MSWLSLPQQAVFFAVRASCEQGPRGFQQVLRPHGTAGRVGAR